MERRFALIGHRAQSNGKLNLNDLAGGAGRMDVLVRAVNLGLFLSHGIREDAHVTLHLMGGPGPMRRIWFSGPTLKGVHPDERAIAGQISKVLQEPAPAIGQWVELSHGIWHSGGDLESTLREWAREDITTVVMDADAPRLWEAGPIDADFTWEGRGLGFILSDDQAYTAEDEAIFDAFGLARKSLGDLWIQGHGCIAVIHHLLDAGTALFIE